MENSSQSREQILDELKNLQTALTEQQRIQASLQQEIHDYRQLVNWSPEGIFIHRDGFFLFLNQTAIKIFGLASAENIEGRSLFDFLLPQYHDLIKHIIEKTSQENHPTDLVGVKIKRLDGTVIDLEWIAAPIRYEGRPARQVFVRDITPRKQAEYRLEQSEAKFRLLIETVPAPVFIHRGEKYVYVNPAFCTFTGYTLEESLQLDFWQLTNPDKRDLIKQSGQARVRGEEVNTQFEYRIATKNGEQRWVFTQMRTIEYEGKRAGLGTLTDISRRKQIERQLSIEKERLNVILSNIEDGVITTDRDGKVVLINTGAEKLIGWSQAEAQGKQLDTIFHILDPQTEEKVPSRVEAVLEAKATIYSAHNFILIARDGTRYLIQDGLAPIYDPQTNTPVGIVIAFHEVSQQLNTDQVMSRVRSLESLGVIASGIAHDFNNILTALVANISLARLTAEESQVELQELLTEAENAVFRASGLTQQFLSVARSKTPKLSRIRLETRLRDWTTFALRGTNTTYQFDLSPDLWSVNVDENQISQVVHNLVLNAQQAMPHGGVITIAARNIPASNLDPSLVLEATDYIQISIRDEGVGISEDVLPYIFDPYFTTKRRGSGLGLAMSYSIISRHGGSITVSSQLGVGSTFFIYLPALREK